MSVVFSAEAVPRMEGMLSGMNADPSFVAELSCPAEIRRTELLTLAPFSVQRNRD